MPAILSQRRVCQCCSGSHFFFNQFVEPVLIVGDPVGKLLVNNLPVIPFLFLHFKHDPVAPVVGNVNMEQAIGIAREEPEIEFAKAVRGLNQLGEVDISSEGEIHTSSLCDPNVQWSCFICLTKS